MVVSFLVLAPFLFGASWVDIHQRRIPNRLLGCAWLAWLFLSLSGSGIGFGVGFVWAAAIGMPLLLLSILCPDGFGAGDAKLAATVALFTGALSVYSLVLASAMGVVAALALPKTRTEGIPFAPFISAGALATFVLG